MICLIRLLNFAVLAIINLLFIELLILQPILDNLPIVEAQAISIDVYDVEEFSRKIDPTIYSAETFPKSKGPVTVNVSLILDHFGPYDFEKSQFTASLRIQLSWYDKRLALFSKNQNSQKALPEKDLTNYENLRSNQIDQLKIWKPKIYFSNAMAFGPDLLSDKANGLTVGRITADGKVIIVKRTTMSGKCKVDIKLYPMDVQKCFIQMQTTNLDQHLSLQWSTTEPLVVGDDYTWNNFDWIDYTLRSDSVTDEQIHIGPFARLEAIFVLRRQLGYFLLQTYLPSVLFVTASWASFWISIPAAPARVALVLTTMLTHVTSSKAIHDKLPRVSYVTSLDVWVMVCTMFIFASLVEYATANYFYHKQDRIKDRDHGVAVTKPKEVTATGTSANIAHDARRRKSATAIEIEEAKTTTTTANNNNNNNNKNNNASPIRDAWRNVLHRVVPPYEKIVPRRTALDIDRKSRVIFPVAFALFNAFYWTILLVASYHIAERECSSA